MTSAQRLTPSTWPAWLLLIWASGTVAATSSSGLTGLTHIPSADVLDDGDVEVRADSFVNRDKAPRYNRGYNTGMAIGFLPGFEISGRLADFEGPNGRFVVRLRDLSVNGKWRLPLPDGMGLPRIALGATDQGGAASHFKSTFGVATHTMGPLDLTLGYGRGPDQLKGWFGGVQLTTPVEGLSALAEHDSRDKYLGLRYVSPWEALGDARLIGTLSRSFGARDSLGTPANRTLVGFSLHIPLGRGSSSAGTHLRRGYGSATGDNMWSSFSGQSVQMATAVATGPAVVHWQAADGTLTVMPLPKASETQFVGLEKQLTEAPNTSQPTLTTSRVATPLGSEPANGNDHQAALRVAHAQLKAAGLDHVQVGTRRARADTTRPYDMTPTWVARLESALYTRNDADAVGVALGVLAKASAGVPVDELVLVLERAGQGIYQVRVNRDAWLNYLDGDDVNGVRNTLQVTPGPGPGTGEDEVNWLSAPVERQDKVRLSVGLRYTAYYATEVGVYDYSIAPAVTAHVPLWTGAELSATRVLPPLESHNFDRGFVFSGAGIRSGLSQAALNQSWWLGSHILNVSSVGRYFYDQWGVQHESVAFLPWNADTLRLRFTKTRRASGETANAAAADKESAQLTYRWQLPSLQGYTELHWNRYISGDTGPSVDFRRFFGDFQFGLTLRSSARDKFAGLTVELPLLPGRGWSSGAGFSVSSERVAQTGVLSRVGNTHNSVAADAAVLTPYDYNVTNWMLNRNRWQQAFFLQELPRLKAAYKAEVSKLHQSSSAPVPTNVSNPKGNP